MLKEQFQSVLEAVHSGKMIVIVDDRDRENEGDLMVAAQLASTEAVNFMAQHGRGLVCLSLAPQICDALMLEPQVADNRTYFGTNFTVSIDLAGAGAAAPSASARAACIRHAADERAKAADFSRPGFVFPLRAVPGGVLRRRGQTEASVDVARLAGLRPAAVICEVLGEDGAPLRGEVLSEFCKRFKLQMIRVQDVVDYRLRHEIAVRRTAERVLTPQELGGAKSWKVISYVDDADGVEHAALVYGELQGTPLVRLHSQCLTGDLLGSQRCDCGEQLRLAREAIEREVCGVLIYLQQEGRGIGLGAKLQAYELQDAGRDTVEANLELGFEADERSYRAGAKILSDLGVQSVRLLTNNPHKLQALRDYGITVERVPLVAARNCHNERYLEAKRTRLGHLL